MRDEQVSNRGFASVISGIGGATLGGFLTKQKQKEEEKAIAKQQKNIMQTLSTVKEMNAMQKQDLLEAQRQRRERNLLVQSSSGFEQGSFDILNTSGLSKDVRAVNLFDKQVQLQEEQILASMPSQKGEWQKAFEIIGGIGGLVKTFI